MQYLAWYIFLGSFIVFIFVVLFVAYSLRLRCPECRGEVEEVSRKIAIRSTKMHPGLVRTVFRCLSCGHSFSRKKVLPQLGAWVTYDVTGKGPSEPVELKGKHTNGIWTGYGRVARSAGRYYTMFGGGRSCRMGKSK